MNKTIVMFDMDGTLTESRCKFACKELQEQLYRLTNHGIHVGIITGSDEDYLREQMSDFLNNSSCRYKTHLLPCNGTKYFQPPQFPNQDFRLVHEVSMKDQIGEENYRRLIQELIMSQVIMTRENIPLTGHFINCRGSLINWCPIGRNADGQQRKVFLELDKRKNLRNNFMLSLVFMLNKKDLNGEITVKLGGDTSFDIYPKGWDKTYGLRHFTGWDTWFVGDRCEKNGNDYEIFHHCGDQSYETTGPSQTAEIIIDIMRSIRERE